MPVKLSLRKMLAQVGMEQYLSLCSDRIASAMLIDWKDVEIDFLDFPSLIFTPDGLMICSEILEGYLGQDKFMSLWKMARAESDIVEGINIQLSSIRKLKSKVLMDFIKEPKKFIQPDNEMDDSVIEKMKDNFRAELKSRSMINRARILTKDTLMQIYIRVKHARLICVVDQSFKMASKKYMKEK